MTLIAIILLIVFCGTGFLFLSHAIATQEPEPFARSLVALMLAALIGSSL
jgi:hypothetical protein